MTILSMPSAPGIRAVTFGLRANTMRAEAGMTPFIATYPRVGAKWFAQYDLPPMLRADAAAWCAFLCALNGRAGRFYGGDPSATTPRGAATGTPTVNGGSQTGTSLITAGWTAGVTGILLVGDYIAFATPTGRRELHKVTANANSGVAGACTLSIAPAIRESPANGATIIKASTTCVMRLTGDEEAAWDVDEAMIYGMRFAAEEVFPKGIF